MASSIAHEIRNPMTTVRGFLQLFSNKMQHAEEREYFQLMIDELDRSNAIISEFLSLAKNKQIKLKKVSLNQIIENMTPLIKADALKADKNIYIKLGDIPDILLDENEIRQLILNLVRNGLEAIEPGGNVSVSTFVSGHELIMEVADNGCGIPEEVMDKIGQPFFTTKKNGTGLGVSVCYNICQRHNAKIDFKTGGTGTTVCVKFLNK